MESHQQQQQKQQHQQQHHRQLPSPHQGVQVQHLHHQQHQHHLHQHHQQQQNYHHHHHHHQQQASLQQVQQAQRTSMMYPSTTALSILPTSAEMRSSEATPVGRTEKKATHSEIEKRRRLKMNKHIHELANHIPCGKSNSKKLDKITILKMAVQHLKNLKYSTTILNDSFGCQDFIAPVELQTMVLGDCDDFLIAIKCDSGKILFASDSCRRCVGATASELVGRVFFEIIHPADTKLVKDQLIYYDMRTAGQQSAVSSLTSSQPNLIENGDRRSFVCRVRDSTAASVASVYSTSSSSRSSRSSSSNNSSKNGTPSPTTNSISNSADAEKPNEYHVIHFVGYLRSNFDAVMRSNNASSGSRLSSSGGVSSLRSVSLSSSLNSSYSQRHAQQPHQSECQTPSSSSGFRSKCSSVDSNLMLAGGRRDRAVNIAAASESAALGGAHSMPMPLSMSSPLPPPLPPPLSTLEQLSGDARTSGAFASAVAHKLTFLEEVAAAGFSREASNSGARANISSGSRSTANNGGDGAVVGPHYLLAYGRSKPIGEHLVDMRFNSRHDATGCFIHVEPNVYTLTGCLPQQLLAESIYQRVHADDVAMLRHAFQQAVSSSNKAKVRTEHFRFETNRYRNGNGSGGAGASGVSGSGVGGSGGGGGIYVLVESVLFGLHNPFSGEFEYVVAQHTLVGSLAHTSQQQQNQQQQQQQQQHQQAPIPSAAQHLMRRQISGRTNSISSSSYSSGSSKSVCADPDDTGASSSSSLLSLPKTKTTNSTTTTNQLLAKQAANDESTLSAVIQLSSVGSGGSRQFSSPVPSAHHAVPAYAHSNLNNRGGSLQLHQQQEVHQHRINQQPQQLNVQSFGQQQQQQQQQLHSMQHQPNGILLSQQQQHYQQMSSISDNEFVGGSNRMPPHETAPFTAALLSPPGAAQQATSSGVSTVRFDLE